MSRALVVKSSRIRVPPVSLVEFVLQDLAGSTRAYTQAIEDVGVELIGLEYSKGPLHASLPHCAVSSELEDEWKVDTVAKAGAVSLEIDWKVCRLIEDPSFLNNFEL
ncbi:unnamed protein product [Trichobilharzia regenti]|nr:unnamed protein product [Trichobilharzia regenti]